VLVVLLLLPPLFYATLRISAIQTYLTHKAAAYLSRELKTEISVGGVDISWFLDIVIEDIKVNDLHRKTLLSAARIKFDFEDIEIRKHHLQIKELSIENADVNLIVYKGDSLMNLQFIVDYFTSADTSVSAPSKPWQVGIDGLKLKQTHFLYQDQRYMQPEGIGMDFSNIDVSDINLKLSGLGIVGDTISGRMEHLSCKELSGLEIHEMSAGIRLSPVSLQTKNLKLVTNKSNLSLDIQFRYPNFNAFNYFIDSVNMFVDIKPSSLNLQDISFFAPDLNGMDDELQIDGLVKGTVTSLKAKNFNLEYGEKTKFFGNINLEGLPDIEETFIQLKVKNFTTISSDIAAIRLPGNDSANRLTLPDEINKLGFVKIKGIFTGFYNDFVSNATFVTDVGTVKTDLLLKKNLKTRLIEYDGKITANQFNLGEVLDMRKYAGKLSLNAEVKGMSLSAKTVDLTIDGSIDSADFYGNSFRRTIVKGHLLNRTFNGSLKLDDELLKLNFDGLVDYSQEIPRFNFDVRIDEAMLTKLHLGSRDPLSRLSTIIHSNFTGDRLDDMLGSLVIDSTSYTEHGKTYHMKQLLLKTTMDSSYSKSLKLTSDFIDAQFTGQYTFDDFFHYLNNIFVNYLPSIRVSGFATGTAQEQNRKFNYIINLKNTRSITDLFIPALHLDGKTRISGSFDSNMGLIEVNGSSPMITYGNTSLKNWFIVGSSQSNFFKLNIGCSKILFGDSTEFGIDELAFYADVHADTVAFRFTWNDLDKADHNTADINGLASFNNYPEILLKVKDARVKINDTLWTVNSDNYIRIDTSSVEVHNFRINGNNQSMLANGSVSVDPLDKLTLTFDKFNISHLDLLLNTSGVDFDGFMSGAVDVSGVYDVPNFVTDIVIAGFCFNKEKLGDLTLKSSWNQSQEAIVLDSRIVYTGNAGTTQPMIAKGFFYPNRKTDNFDIDVSVTNLKIKTLSPFFTGLFSNINGLATGSLKLKGDLSSPQLIGAVKLMRTEIKVDYLNVGYSFATDFNFGKDVMWFDNVKVFDSIGNQATVSGKIYHHNFAKWILAINIDAKNICGLNTTRAQNELFYGDGFGTGRVTISGPVENLNIDVNMRTDKGTNIYLPYSSAIDASQQNFIVFVNHNDTIHKEDSILREFQGLTLKLDFDVTKDANIQFFLPSQMGDIKVKGDGNMHLGVDKSGSFTMRGSYTMEQGVFLFTLQKVISRSLRIEQGSTITWAGDPYNAEVDLSAVYKTKVLLSGIPALANDPALQGKRAPVDCVVKMKNSLMNPDLAFSFRLPNTDDNVRQMVFNAIDTTNTAEMNQQMISLLVLNSFSFSTENTSVAGSLGVSSFELLSRQLSNQLSRISKDVDIGVNYTPGSSISSDEIQVALSTQVLNDRVLIDGSVATSNNSASQNTSQIVGDVNVEVKITPDGQLRVKAFNRSNSNLDFLNSYAPYTQGVGIFYRKEFDHFGDLFKTQRKIVEP
jgi:hypothetical protein